MRKNLSSSLRTKVALLSLLIGIQGIATVRADPLLPLNEVQAKASARPDNMPLAQLPSKASIRLPPVEAPQRKALDKLINHSSAQEAQQRDLAHDAILDAQSAWLSAIARFIDEIAARRDRSNMASVLKTAIQNQRTRQKSRGNASLATPDYLEVLLQSPQPSSQSWSNLVQLLTLSRMLVQINSTAACRELIRIYVRFGDFLRIDTQRQLELLGDGSLAALIEAQRHPARKIQAWAQKQLKVRDRLDPQKAVRTDDPRALADILIALGRANEAENARIILSYASSNRELIRQGARQAIAQLGRLASWQLKDAYLAITGKQPERDWTWQRTARELFTEYDRIRVQELYRIYGEANKQSEAKEYSNAAQSYGRLLALSPQFSEGNNIAPHLLKAAEALHLQAADEQGISKEKLLDLATTSAYRVERISNSSALKQRAHALILSLKHQSLVSEGFYDRALSEESKQLNPELRSNAAIEPTSSVASGWNAFSRYGLALIAALLTLMGLGLVLRSMKRALR